MKNKKSEPAEWVSRLLERGMEKEAELGEKEFEQMVRALPSDAVKELLSHGVGSLHCLQFFFFFC